jgi:hypothetical protein
MKIEAAISVESVSKRPKNRDFARLYWKDEDSLDIMRREKRRRIELAALVEASD